MDETQVEQTTQNEETAQSAPETTTPEAEEKTPIDLLLDEMDAMKARIAQLEAAMASHGHSINIGGDTIDQIANLAMQKINALIRARLGRV